MLPNCRLLYDRLAHTIAAGKRNNHYAALLLLDLDNFKSLNAAHGHEVGDEFVVLPTELSLRKDESAVQTGVK